MNAKYMYLSSSVSRMSLIEKIPAERNILFGKYRVLFKHLPHNSCYIVLFKAKRLNFFFTALLFSLNPARFLFYETETKERMQR